MTELKKIDYIQNSYIDRLYGKQFQKLLSGLGFFLTGSKYKCC